MLFDLRSFEDTGNGARNPTESYLPTPANGIEENCCYDVTVL